MAAQQLSEQLALISRQHVVDAFAEIGQEPIAAGDKFDVVYKGERFDPKLLLAQAYLVATASEAQTKLWQDLSYSDFVAKLTELGFRVVRNPKNEGDTALTVMVYEVKRPETVQANYQKLFSPDRKRFYWNGDKFAKLKAGDPVFVVNTKMNEVLFCTVEAQNIKTEYHHEKDTTSFSHIGQPFEVAGKWGEFICLKIRETISTAAGWKWKSLGSSEHSYLSGPNISADTALNNIFRTNQLLEASWENSESEIQLQVCFQALKKKLPEKSVKNDDKPQEIEPTLWYVMQGSTYTPEQGQKYLWAPLVDKAGNPQKHHIALKDVKRGHFVVHHCGGVVAISKATSNPSEESNAFDESRWDMRGTKVDVQLVCELSTKISVSEIAALRVPLAKALSGQRGPYNSRGLGNQGYLFEFTWEALAILMQKTDVKLPEDVSRWLPEVDLEELIVESTEDEFESVLPQRETETSAKVWLPLVQQYIATNGFDYSLSDIANFYLALHTKPLLILAGISGTGKTQLVRQFAKAIGYGDVRHCALIPVRPDWADNADLIGYRNIQGEFEQQRLLRVMQDALAHPDEPFFIILDEMNLARVEHYFSDFLSVLETRERGEGDVIYTSPIVSDPTVNHGVPVTIPQNMVFVGTVNMDETTHPFSRKVLDRANAIEMNQVSLPWGEEAETSAEALKGLYADAFVTPYINSVDLNAKQKAELNPVIELLVRINTILEPAGLHFGYRVRDEMAFYLSLHKDLELADAGIMTFEDALDYQLMQKVLPRIQGSALSVRTALQLLLAVLSGADIEAGMELPEIQKAVDAVSTDLKYPRSVKKLLFMLQRFNDDGFTSFWL